MTQGYRVVGLLRLKDAQAFDAYRAEVGTTVAACEGRIVARSTVCDVFWNELGSQPFTATVELAFPSADHARAWASSPAYLRLLEVRQQAFDLLLFGIEPA